MFVTGKTQTLSKNHCVIGLCTAINILDKWGASTKQACSVLGISLKTYTHAKSAEDAKWAVNLDIDVIQRVSLILNIHSALCLIFDNPDNVYGFVGMKNDNEFFNDRAPLEIMAQGDFVSLYETFNRIESLCTAGW